MRCDDASGRVDDRTRSFLIKECGEVLGGRALCTVTGCQDKCSRHELSELLTLLGIGCSDHSTHVAVTAVHRLLTPFADLLSYQFIHGDTALSEDILEFTAGRIGCLDQDEDALVACIADIHERLNAVGSQIGIDCREIDIEDRDLFSGDPDPADMRFRVGSGCRTDITALHITDDDKTLLPAVFHRLFDRICEF